MGFRKIKTEGLIINIIKFKFPTQTHDGKEKMISKIKIKTEILLKRAVNILMGIFFGGDLGFRKIKTEGLIINIIKFKFPTQTHDGKEKMISKIKIKTEILLKRAVNILMGKSMGHTMVSAT